MGKAAGKGKERWPQVRLGDVCTITMGQSPESSSYNDRGDGLPFYQGNADFGNLHPTTRYWCSRPKKLADINDVLISVRAPIGAVNLAVEKCCIGRGLASITAKNNCSDFKYLYYALISKTNELNVKGTGSTFKAIKKTTLEETQIPLPPLPEQRRIAAVLDQVSSLIALRKAQLAKLDLLVKARFVEMFGEPSINPMSWPIKNIATILDGKVSNGFFAKREAYTAEGNVSVLGVANVVNRMYSQCNNLPKTNGTQKEIDKYSVKYGDILFCRSSLVAEGIGKASIVPKEIPQNVLFECHIIRMQLDLSKCVPEYIQVLTTTDYFRQQIISQSKTATMTTIEQDGILKSNIILPPLSLQKEFLDFIEKTNKSKLEIQQGLIQLNTLKKSLMQEYFG